MFTLNDRSWLEKEYPSLKCDGYSVVGQLDFRMLYSPETANYILWPNAKEILKANTIYHADIYSLKIEWPRGQLYPSCFETTTKIKDFALQSSTLLEDMHINPSGDFCLAAPQVVDLDFENGFELKVFIEKFVVPFLFLQTHYRKTKKWAWPTASHGLAGIFWWYHLNSSHPYAKQLTLKYADTYGLNTPESTALLRRLRRGLYKGHMACICGKKDTKIRKCCPDALYGLNVLRREMIALLQERLERSGAA